MHEPTRSVGRGRGPGGRALHVTVRARPVDGAADAAVVVAVAEAFLLPRRNVRIVSGLRGRDKTLDLDGDSALLSDRLAGLLVR